MKTKLSQLGQKIPVMGLIVAVVLAGVLFTEAYGQALDISPGVERWPVKTSLLKKSRSKFVPLQELLSLPSPINEESEAPDTARIPAAVGSRNLKEGDLIRTSGWLQLVALERDSHTKRDGDYHIQIRTDSTWDDTCLVVEVPYPPLVNDPSLRNSCEDVRAFIQDSLLKGKDPSTGGNVMTHPVYVTVKGQLFFDASHLKGEPRGKKGRMQTKMRSYTPWEIHPVVSIWFEKKPAR